MFACEGMLLLVPLVALGQPGMEGMGFGSGRRMRDKEPLAVKEDLPCIRCDVCEIVAEEIYENVEKARSMAPVEVVRSRPGGPKAERSTFSEVEVNNVVVDACNRRKEAGEWLWYVDLVETASEKPAWGIWRDLTKKEAATKKNYLLLDVKSRDGPVRKWDRESATLKRSCDLLFDDDVEDLEDFIVPLWRGLDSKKKASQLLCKELTTRCKGKRVPVPAAGRRDFDYVDEAKNLLETERMMQSMEEQGMPMVMQSRDDMMQELVEQLVDEGMSEDEAHEFIEATTANQGIPEEDQGHDLPQDEADYEDPDL
eukprot:CAMPEP_0118905998 /NCGR_PEP_ID=MMETSP1166-20130328/9729_1 /TAXON_ID=1104430 /ORGANISM="Chrysoreinhardia sp, Strain CCMP3193" /LENGTH=311 /DNA_ID=CAMNT_0006845269 /DNA_START=45 /DNA_END=980 /DNA_ORIENTATION=-